MLTPFLVLYLVLVALNLLDGFTTWKFVKPDHYGREANPIARWLFSRLGILRGIILAEALWIGLISLVFWLAWDAPVFSDILLALLIVGILVFSYVVANNLLMLRRTRVKAQHKDQGSC